MTEKNLDYYLNLNWTLVEGVDIDFDGNPYHFVEIKEIPSFLFCAKTAEKARENYKTQLKWTLQVMLESGEHIVEPGEENDEPDWVELLERNLYEE